MYPFDFIGFVTTQAARCFVCQTLLKISLDLNPFTELNHHVCIFSFTAFSLIVTVLERHPLILMLDF